MSYTERELSEALYRALNPEPQKPNQKTLQTRQLLESIRPVIERVPSRAANKDNGVLEQEGHLKQIR